MVIISIPGYKGTDSP
ncbi:uncharacterized protein FFNC_03286 [Fusarium fujikuroi]|nr:uncharacterized protein FFNC_03286 [Fusarium fujikuroi]